MFRYPLQEVKRMGMRISMEMKERHDAAAAEQFLESLAGDERVQRMRDFRQHGSVTTYGHCKRVAYMSLRISRGFRLRVKEKEMVTGAMLHDYYLYDWHESGHPDHAYGHAGKAADNARRDFGVGDHEYEIIRTHMWPISPFHWPSSMEAAIVCVADKLCTLEETFFHRH